MNIFLAEVVGTALLVLLGNGVVANQVLAKTKGHDTGWMMITTGWGLAVAMGAYSVGRISGAHLNPAVTLGLASIGQLEASLIPTYFGAQMLGAFLGALLVYLVYLPHWKETESAEDKLAAFATGPAIRTTGPNLFSEFVGTGVLVFGILAIGANAGELTQDGTIDLSAVFSTGLNPLLVGFLVWAIGLCLGGPTGYAINPARDLGPRIAHAVLPISGKGDSDWSYAWIPVVGPLAGGAAGALLFQALGF
ncbi:MAG: MIP/aquaporin family protein [Acidobacteriota bacterium]